MIQKLGILGVFLFLLSLLCSGCQTAKGAAYGVGATAVGAVKDTENTYNCIMKADDWIKRNLW